jgi:hypothetical protein
MTPGAVQPEATQIEYALTPAMPENAISWETALSLATKELNTQILDTEQLETYVKVLCDKQSANSPFWSVNFATAKGETFFCILDPNGNIIGK